ncbi:MAG TPA: ArsR family transcriptional regulator [Sulfurimonas sp.]|nr:ArsR family transcriptional regulator [Sulfurimonas sp.]
MHDLVKIAKIFSDINRINIIVLILRDKELCVCEICDTLELSQPLVSRHLKQMKQANILEARQEKKWMIYTLNKGLSSFSQCFIQELKKHSLSLPKLISCSKI